MRESTPYILMSVSAQAVETGVVLMRATHTE